MIEKCSNHECLQNATQFWNCSWVKSCTPRKEGQTGLKPRISWCHSLLECSACTGHRCCAQCRHQNEHLWIARRVRTANEPESSGPRIEQTLWCRILALIDIELSQCSFVRGALCNWGVKVCCNHQSPLIAPDVVQCKRTRAFDWCVAQLLTTGGCWEPALPSCTALFVNS